MNRSVYFRIFKVHYNDLPVNHTLSWNIKAVTSGSFRIESCREELCDSHDPSLFNTHLIIMFNKREDAIITINRYHLGRFMNRYVMKVDFYRPNNRIDHNSGCDKQQYVTYIHDISPKKEFEPGRSRRYSSSDRRKRTRSNSGMRDSSRRRQVSPEYHRIPFRQSKRHSDSSSDTSTSSSESNPSSPTEYSKDLRQKLSVKTKINDVKVETKEAFTHNWLTGCRERPSQQTVTRTITTNQIPTTKFSDSCPHQLSSKSDKNPYRSPDFHKRQVTFTSKSDIYQHIQNVIPTVLTEDRRDQSKCSESEIPANSTEINQSCSARRYVKFSPIKFRSPSKNDTLTVKSKDNRRIISITKSQIPKDSNKSTKMINGLTKNPENDVMQSSRTSEEIKENIFENSSITSGCDSVRSLRLIAGQKDISTTKKQKTLSEVNTNLTTSKINKKIQFNIKNSISVIRDSQVFSYESDTDVPEDAVTMAGSKRKRNKSEFSFPSQISNKQKLYKSKSFNSYDTARISTLKPTQKKVELSSLPIQRPCGDFPSESSQHPLTSDICSDKTETLMEIVSIDSRNVGVIQDTVLEKDNISLDEQKIQLTTNFTQSMFSKDNQPETNSELVNKPNSTENPSETLEIKSPVPSLVASSEQHPKPSETANSSFSDEQVHVMRQTSQNTICDTVTCEDKISNVSTDSSDAKKLQPRGSDLDFPSSIQTILSGSEIKSNIPNNTLYTKTDSSNCTTGANDNVNDSKTVENLCELDLSTSLDLTSVSSSFCEDSSITDSFVDNTEKHDEEAGDLQESLDVSESNDSSKFLKSTEPISNNLKRPLDDNVCTSAEIKSNPNPSKRQKYENADYSLVNPNQMSYLLGQKEKLEKLYNEECRTVCNVVQLLISQDSRLEEKIEESLIKTLENIGEKYVKKLEETVLELSDLEWTALDRSPSKIDD